MSRLLKGPVPRCHLSLHLQTRGESSHHKQEVMCHSLIFSLTWCGSFLLRVLNLHSQGSPVSRAPSMPPVETSYIPPPPPLIQDYRHYYHTTSDLPGKPATCLKSSSQYNNHMTTLFWKSYWSKKLFSVHTGCEAIPFKCNCTVRISQVSVKLSSSVAQHFLIFFPHSVYLLT